jgi:hypothetical protein
MLPRPGGPTVPTRRIFEMTVVTIMLTRPVFGSVRLWSVKTMANTQPGTVLHTVAEVLSILT